MEFNNLMENTFTFIYENKIWGDNQNQEYNGSSGTGSDVDYNKYVYIPFLKNFINDQKIKNIVDLGCGDFRCGKLIYEDLDIKYTGYDVYKKIADYNIKNHTSDKYSFIHLDFCNFKEDIKEADLYILKDVIQHWSIKDIYEFLDYLTEKKNFKYLLICNCCNQNYNDEDINNGEWRPLNSDYYPLKKYNPIKLFTYNTKEVSIIIKKNLN